jgi:hypothetical protein
MRTAIICLGLVLFLGGCGSSSQSGTTVAPRPRVSRIALLQHDLERDYGLHDAHCEQDVHGDLRGHYVCLAEARSLRVQMAVTQTKPGRRPVVTSCEGARKTQGKSFFICGLRPGKAG